MKRLLILAVAGSGVLCAQSGIGPPLAGYARDPAGCLRPFYGVFGNLVAGPPAACGVLAADFSGRAGLVRTSAGVFAFDADGGTFRRLPPARPDSPLRRPPSGVLVVEGEHLVLRRAGAAELRLRVEGAVLAVERMNQVWFLVHQAGRSLVVREADDRLETCVLPEPVR